MHTLEVASAIVFPAKGVRAALAPKRPKTLMHVLMTLQVACSCEYCQIISQESPGQEEETDICHKRDKGSGV